MSQWHRAHPVLVGTSDDPWMVHESYRKLVPPPAREDVSACGFCQGQPVANAQSWADGKPRPPLPCPRCGETNQPAESENHRPLEDS